MVIDEKIKKEDLEKAKEHYKLYIKITADLQEKIVIIGGEYHADAEELLLKKYKSRQKNIWGGGFNLSTKKFETNAIINIKPGINESMEILNSQTRSAFLELVQSKLQGLENLL